MEVSPPQGLYWSYSLGNPWWETIDYGSHQSSLNGHQATVDDDGVLRTVIAHEDPGRGQLARHGRAQRGARHSALRPHRDGTGAHDAVVPFSDIDASLPATTRRVTPGERRATLAARRLAVSKRFCR